MTDTPTHSDIMGAVEILRIALQRVETKVDELVKAVGTEGEDEHGAPVGTGIRGRVMRMEVWRRNVDSYRLRAVTALAVGSIFIIAIWWLIQDKVGHVLK